MFLNLGVVWKVSANWASKNFNCTLTGIPNCDGNCCHYKSFWPSTSSPDFICPFLKPDGCSLTIEQKPITCLLYPLRLNKQNTLVIHARTTYKKGICGGNFGSGNLPLVVALEKQLIHLFGKAEYDKLVHSIVTLHKDYYVKVPQFVLDALKQEEQLESKNLKPIPRR